MRTAKPVTAFRVADAKREDFPTVSAMCLKFGIAQSYAIRKIGTGVPCKGFLIFETHKADSPEAKDMVRAVCLGMDKREEAAEARRKRMSKEAKVSVRIDRKTVILVPASKWTPDYAERYKARMEASKPQQRWSGDQCMRMWNDTIKTPKKKKK